MYPVIWARLADLEITFHLSFSSSSLTLSGKGLILFFVLSLVTLTMFISLSETFCSISLALTSSSSVLDSGTPNIIILFFLFSLSLDSTESIYRVFICPSIALVVCLAIASLDARTFFSKSSTKPFICPSMGLVVCLVIASLDLEPSFPNHLQSPLYVVSHFFCISAGVIAIFFLLGALMCQQLLLQLAHNLYSTNAS